MINASQKTVQTIFKNTLTCFFAELFDFTTHLLCYANCFTLFHSQL